jgi:nitroreductase
MHADTFQAIVERRRSNRSYDPAVQVPDEVIRRSLERAVLAPNSSNMQLWEFYWIKSAEEMQKFASYCLGQSAARTAQHMVVFVTRRDHWKKRARWNYEQVMKSIQGEPNGLQKKALKYYGTLMPLMYSPEWLGLKTLFLKVACFVMGLSRPFARIGGNTYKRIVVHKTCALAAQTFMLSIAAEGFDSCPMEGFDQVRVRRALGLPRQAEINMIVSVGLGTERGFWWPRRRVPLEEVIFER